MEKDKIRYFQVTPGTLFDICFKIIKIHGLSKAISGKEISKYDNVDIYIEDEKKSAPYFKDGGKVLLSVPEAISMAYVATYYREKASDKKAHTYSIAVDIEDKHKSLTAREQYLSDGVLAIKGTQHKDDSITPFQQVMAQNVIGKNIGNDIEQEIISQIKRKTNRRSSYHDVSGLIIGIYTNGGSVDIANIAKHCDLEEFQPVFLIFYMDDLKRARVMYLHEGVKSIDELKEVTLDITPRLKSNQNTNAKK